MHIPDFSKADQKFSFLSASIYYRECSSYWFPLRVCNFRYLPYYKHSNIAYHCFRYSWNQGEEQPRIDRES
jgi:hypothetical protein